ncbi:MAG TPA: hypothetical protein VJR89_10675 [Polyangiales bacterium]|nr:hypothetical protein [Polyangiales bacterium]
MTDASRSNDFARCLFGLAVATTLTAASGVHAQPRALDTQAIATVVGRYAAPERKAAGVYGSDLGWTFQHKGRLWVMFGDTWQDDVQGKRDMGVRDPVFGFPAADDALGFISLSPNGGFPDGAAVEAFLAAQPAPQGLEWRTPSPTIEFARLNNDSTSLAGPMRPVRDGLEMTSTPAQTPVAGFSNARSGTASGAFGIFLQNEKLLCGDSGKSCSKGYECATDIGVCIAEVDGKVMDGPLPFAQPCVLGGELHEPSCVRCDAVPWFHGGMCVDKGSSVHDETEVGRTAAVVRIHQVGNARENNPLQFDSQNWITQRFFNPAVRTVSDFVASRANGAGNDYRIADGVNPEREGVFIWGRPNFGGSLAAGRDAQLYLAWVPMPSYSRNGRFAWQPEYFKEVDASGRPVFVKGDEREAKPLDLDAAQPGVQPEEQLDVVGQMTVAWLPNLKRWIMLYGGGMNPAFGELIFGTQPFDASKAGPIYVRYAEHPWGPWTAPEPLLDPRTSDLAGPGGIMFSPQCGGGSDCAQPEAAWPTHLGSLYGPDVIDPWTTAHPDGTTDIYWHVSTWNPYQVLLMRTTLRGQ